MVSASPRKRSPIKSRRFKAVASSDTARCGSPCRRSRRNRPSGSLASSEEPPPTLSSETLVDCDPADGLLGSFPLPLGINSWDWPLSRDEQKALVLMFDRQELMVQRDEYAEQLQRLKLRSRHCATLMGGGA